MALEGKGEHRVAFLLCRHHASYRLLIQAIKVTLTCCHYSLFIFHIFFKKWFRVVLFSHTVGVFRICSWKQLCD